jgi:hypothetical protein
MCGYVVAQRHDRNLVVQVSCVCYWQVRFDHWKGLWRCLCGTLGCVVSFCRETPPGGVVRGTSLHSLVDWSVLFSMGMVAQG